MTPLLDKSAIEERIPHRDPMLFVDCVLTWEGYKNLHALRTFQKEDPLFRGHFPKHPVLPGVMQIEALAQASALLINLSLNKTAEETLFLFMGIDTARFLAPVNPDDEMHLHVTMEKNKANIFWFKGEVHVAEKLCTKADFAAKLVA